MNDNFESQNDRPVVYEDSEMEVMSDPELVEEVVKLQNGRRIHIIVNAVVFSVCLLFCAGATYFYYHGERQLAEVTKRLEKKLPSLEREKDSCMREKKHLKSDIGFMQESCDTLKKGIREMQDCVFLDDIDKKFTCDGVVIKRINRALEEIRTKHKEKRKNL
ncbi:hypothetical protein ACFLZH_03785 [Patescibacteria group bacterium]